MYKDNLDLHIDIMAAIPFSSKHNHKYMVFVDGENLSIRFKNIVDNDILNNIDYEEDVYVWNKYLNTFFVEYNIIRKYYYTSVVGDDVKIKQITNKLKQIGIEEPKVFKKTKSRNSKGVDICLATDMITHACKKNYDIAILVAGDGDYIPLVEAVKNEGCRVIIWFIQNGINEKLKQKSDHFWDIGKVLLEKDDNRLSQIMQYQGM